VDHRLIKTEFGDEFLDSRSTQRRGLGTQVDGLAVQPS